MLRVLHEPLSASVYLALITFYRLCLVRLALTLQNLVVTLCATRLNIKKIYLLPTVYLFVLISKKQKNIFTFKINYLVSTTETDIVYCAMRTQY